MTSARGGRATISRAPIGSSAGWARTRPHAELEPALHLHADCGLRAARFDRHLGHGPSHRKRECKIAIVTDSLTPL